MNSKHKKFRKFEGTNGQATVFVLILAVITFVTHRVYIYSGLMLNPDESELLATARLAVQPGGLYANYTTPTYGPVWPEFLSFLNHIGMQLDHFSAHLLAVAMKFLIFVIPQSVAIKKFGFLKLSPIIVPLNITLFLPVSNEFAFLATELLPLLLLTLAVVVIIYARKEISSVIAGCLFTLAFLSKYQSSLMIFILFSFIFLRCLKNGVLDNKSFKYEFLKFSISIFGSFSIFLLLLIYSKTFNIFLHDSLLMSFNYSTAGGFGGGANIFDKFKVGSELLSTHPLLIFSLILFVRIIVSETFPKSTIQIYDKEFQLSNVMCIVFILCLTVGFLTISIPGNGFPHYLLFFLWTQTIYLLALERLAIQNNVELKTYNETKAKSRRKYSETTIGLIILISSFSSVSPSIKSFLNTSTMMENNNLRFDELRTSQALQFCPTNSQVLIWGWSSELFGYFGWVPPPYVVNDVNRIKISYISDDAISRIATAISDKNTDCIFVATGPQYFGGFSTLEGFELLPRDTIQILDLNYSKNTLADGTLVWSRK